MNQGNPPPNWYPDPRGEAELRYWDGNQWTEHTHSGPSGGETVAASVPPAAPPPSTAPPPQSAPPAATAGAGYQHAGYGQPGATAGPAGSSGGGLGSKLPLIIGGVLAVVAIGVILVLVLGGGEETTEEDRVREAAEQVITTEEPSACEELATQDFVEKATGEAGQAAVEACQEEPGSLAEGAEITSTEVDGDQATVEAKLDGGNLDGEAIELGMVKQDDEWKLDELVRTEVVEGPNAETTVTNTVLNFGSSEGSKACDYLSFKGLQAEGGKEACQNKTENFVANTYTVTDATVNGKKATVTVTEPRRDSTIEFTLSHEAGEWKIDAINNRG